MSINTSNQSAPISAFDIKGFCAAHSMSRAHFYSLMNRGEGPRIMRVGRKVLISVEAAAEWRAAQEARTEQSSSDGDESTDD